MQHQILPLTTGGYEEDNSSIDQIDKAMAHLLETYEREDTVGKLLDDLLDMRSFKMLLRDVA